MSNVYLKADRLSFLAIITLLISLSFRVDSTHALEAQATIRGGEDGGTISRHLYGHFAEHLGRCIYDGIWVGENSSIPNDRGIRKDIIDALKALNIPNLRWPGGCYADDYHWRDGIGPRDKRSKRVNIHWGNVVDTNAFGTHEFLDLCELIGADPYIAGKRRQRHSAGDARLARIHDLRRRQRAGQPAPRQRPREAVENSVRRRSATRIGAAAAK